MAERLTDADWDAITEASFRGGSTAWREEIERIMTARVQAARAEDAARLADMENQIERLLALVDRADRVWNHYEAPQTLPTSEIRAALTLVTATPSPGAPSVTAPTASEAGDAKPECPACGVKLSEDGFCWWCDNGPAPAEASEVEGSDRG